MLDIPNQLTDWIVDAAPGQMCVYFTGELSRSCEKKDDDDHDIALTVREIAQRAVNNGHVTLTQRRTGLFPKGTKMARVYEYRMTKLHPDTKGWEWPEGIPSHVYSKKKGKANG